LGVHAEPRLGNGVTAGQKAAGPEREPRPRTAAPPNGYTRRPGDRNFVSYEPNRYHTQDVCGRIRRRVHQTKEGSRVSAEAGRAIGRLKPVHEQNRERARSYLEEIEEAIKYLQALIHDQRYPVGPEGLPGYWAGHGWPTPQELRDFLTSADKTRAELVKALNDLRLG